MRTLRADALEVAALVFAFGVVVARLVDAQIDVLIAKRTAEAGRAFALDGMIDHFAYAAILTLEFLAIN